MERLRDLTTNGPEQAASSILRGIKSVPPSTAAEARVWRRLNAAAPMRVHSLRWSLVVTVALLAGGASAATYVWNVRAVAPHRHEALPKEQPTPHMHMAPSSTPTSEILEMANQPAHSKPHAPVTGRPNKLATPRVGANKLATSTPTAEAQLVQSALLALRRDNDPVTASRKLAIYLQRFPHGVLAEEAAALAVEAAAARKAPELKALAQGYLRQYPQGQYRRKVTESLQGLTTSP